MLNILKDPCNLLLSLYKSESFFSYLKNKVSIKSRLSESFSSDLNNKVFIKSREVFDGFTTLRSINYSQNFIPFQVILLTLFVPAFPFTCKYNFLFIPI